MQDSTNPSESGDRFRRLVSSTPDRICPFLGAMQDRATHAGYPSARNSCFAGRRPARIDKQVQEEHCLTRQHPLCKIYQETVG